MAMISGGALRSMDPGLVLLRLTDGTDAGWACGEVEPTAARAALQAAAGQDPAAIALALPATAEGLDPAAGLVAMAALDLAARQAGVPAALLLGAAPPGASPLVPAVAGPLPPGTIRLPTGAAPLRDALLDAETLLILADPVAAGGPGGVRRLAAAARAFQVEVALAPVPHPAALAGAAQLRAAFPWLRHRPLVIAGGTGPERQPSWRPAEGAGGFGWTPVEPLSLEARP